MQPLTESSFIKFTTESSNCSVLNNDPNKLLCHLTVTTNGGLYGTSGSLPVILYRGLRAYNVSEMIRNLPAYDTESARPNRWDEDNYLINSSQPYYMEISAQPSDFQNFAQQFLQYQVGNGSCPAPGECATGLYTYDFIPQKWYQ